MTDLRQLMRETVEHDHADMVRLAARARTQGTTLRRRRRITAAAGGVATVAILGAGVATAVLVLPGGQDADEITASAGPGSGATRGFVVPEPDEPCTQRRADLTFTPVPEAGDAFSAAVLSVADGTVSKVDAYRSSATCHAAASVSAVLQFAPADGSPAGQVSVSYDPASSGVWGISGEEYVSTCPPKTEDCRIRTLSDGSVLRTHAVHMPLAGGQWEILSAERLIDDYVVMVQAQGPRADDPVGTVLGPDAVLSTRQLGQLATQLTPVP